jgi:mannose-1-phosphate guanylyltransferase
MPEPIIPLIMCGGTGTRLWPSSRESRPKQFLPLFGKHSTFQNTLLRVADPALFGRPIIITNGQYRFLVAEQLAEIGIEADILLEPMRRARLLRTRALQRCLLAPVAPGRGGPRPGSLPKTAR